MPKFHGLNCLAAFTTIALLLATPTSFAQGELLWVDVFRGPHRDSGESLASGRDGEIVVAAQFGFDIHFGGDPIFTTGTGGAVVKFDSGGNHIWSQGLVGSGNAYPRHIAVDPHGNVSVTGEFSGTVDYGGGEISATSGIFVAQYDNAGTHIWSRAIERSGLSQIRGIGADALGNVTITGSFRNTIDFGGGPLTATIVDAFVVQYDSVGDFAWARTFKTVGTDIVVEPMGDIIVTGLFRSTSDFGGGPIVTTTDSIFLVRYDSGGNHIWSKSVGTGQVQAVAVGPDGNIVITGRFHGTRDFGGGPIWSVGGTDIFLAQYDSTGNHIWSKRMGGAGFDDGFGVDIDLLGNIVVTGTFFEEVDFGGGLISSAGKSDIFVAEYNNAGDHIWSEGIGGEFLDYHGDGTVDRFGEVIVTGSFTGSIDFGDGLIRSRSDTDMFLMKFSGDPNLAAAASVLSPTSLTASVVEGQTPPNQFFTVRNAGNKVLDYSITEDAGWLSVSPTFGSSDGESDIVEVVYSTESLAPGTYATPITVTDTATDESRQVLVELTIEGASATSMTGSGGGGCFIATATYGTPMANEIHALREVRDAYLLTNTPGTLFVDTYYRISPALADTISQSPALRATVRVLLAPLVLFSKMLLTSPDNLPCVATPMMLERPLATTRADRAGTASVSIQN